MSWRMFKLDDCLELITYGFTNPMPDSEHGPWKVTAKDIANGRIDFSTARHTTEEAFKNDLTDKSRPIKDDILLTKDGTLGRLAIVGEEQICINQSVALLRLKKHLLLPRYLLYLLQTPEYQGKMMADAGGSTIKHIYITKVNQLLIPVPPLDKQQEIIDVLLAYDSMIDNCNAQIKLLEEAAQRLYKEWFVDLRFPGYENTTVVDGVPEGWVTGKFSDYTDIMSGGTPKTDVAEYYRGSIPFYTPKDSDGALFAFDTLTHISESGLQHCNSQFYPVGTVIITARGTVGKTTILAVPMAMNQSCYALKSDILNSPYYLFFSLNLEVEKLKTMANGGVFNTIIVKTFDQISLTIPQKEVLQAFDQRVTPIMEQIKAKMWQISLLKEARDRLLPKLMNGEIEV